MKYAYVDSSVWITRTEGQSAYQVTVNNKMQSFLSDGWQFCISGAVLLEVLVKPRLEKRIDLLTQYNHLFKRANLLSPFEDLFQNAMLIAETDRVKGMDAIHVAFAHHYGCGLFVTTDPHFRNLSSLPLSVIDLSQVTIT